MTACRPGILVLSLALAGCQILTATRPAPPTSRYLQRDLTVAWPEREYWSLPPVAPAVSPPPAPAALVQPPATPSPVAAALACGRGAC